MPLKGKHEQVTAEALKTRQRVHDAFLTEGTINDAVERTGLTVDTIRLHIKAMRACGAVVLTRAEGKKNFFTTNLTDRAQGDVPNADVPETISVSYEAQFLQCLMVGVVETAAIMQKLGCAKKTYQKVEVGLQRKGIIALPLEGSTRVVFVRPDLAEALLATEQNAALERTRDRRVPETDDLDEPEKTPDSAVIPTPPRAGKKFVSVFDKKQRELDDLPLWQEMPLEVLHHEMPTAADEQAFRRSINDMIDGLRSEQREFSRLQDATPKKQRTVIYQILEYERETGIETPPEQIGSRIDLALLALWRKRNVHEQAWLNSDWKEKKDKKGGTSDIRTWRPKKSSH